MKFLIITHAPHNIERGEVYSYGPYVREMNLWNKYADEVTVITPVEKTAVTKIHSRYDTQINIVKIPVLGFVNLKMSIGSLFSMPIVFLMMLLQMRKTDHIHLRCPGTIGLIGCLAQILFPSKPKTAKYAGNWDPNAKQPLSYKIQKWILRNTFLTRNIKVLVYGDWQEQSKNVIPFFTATYKKNKIPVITKRLIEKPFSFLFVGTLSVGKRPLYAIQFVEQLMKHNIDCVLKLYGEGSERDMLERYIEENAVGDNIQLMGNQDSFTVEQAYRNNDFLMLPSNSEGWPKVVAEAMFWGVIPLVSRVSCVPWMLGEGKRGTLLSLNIKEDVARFIKMSSDKNRLDTMSKEAQQWSHQYTIDDFEEAIKKMM